MKRLVLAVCALAASIACGGGGGGGTTTVSTPAVSISPTHQTNIDQGQMVNFTATVQNDSSGKGVTWSASGTGASGAGCGTFSNITSTSATYNAPATVSANLSITVTATSASNSAASASALVVVTPPPTINTTTVPNASPNANYSATLEASGGVGPLTWTLTSGGLPTGLSLSGSGTISGDPTASGTFIFTVQVADSSSAAEGPVLVKSALNLTVVQPLSIGTTALPAGSEGITYLTGIDVSGGTLPYTVSLTVGSLPPGLTLQASSGVISGMPTAQGIFNFTLEVQDSSPAKQSQSQPLSVVIGPPGGLAITTAALLDGTLGQAYKASLAATGGTPPYTWSISSGGLPSGLSLQASAGSISGSPSALETASFTVTVTDSSATPQTQSQALSIAVDNPPEACTSSGNEAVLNGPYAFSLGGFTNAGFLAVVGSFTADGTGKITAGEVDTNGVLGAQTGALITSASSYSGGPDNRGCATFATPFGTLVTHFSLGGISSNLATGGRMITWSSPSASAYIAAGEILQQNTSAFASGLSGNYVYHTGGWDPSAQGGRDACVGVLSASGNTFYAMEQDCNDAATITNTAAAGAAGTYTSLDANGRGTGIIALETLNSTVAFYMVSGGQLLTVNGDPGPFLSGEWDQQHVPSGGAGFTQASLKGSLTFFLSGLSLVNTATTVSVETATADGTSSMAINYYEDRAGQMQAGSLSGCTYAAEANGRITLTSTTLQSCGGNPPVIYLTGPNSGFIVDTAPGVDTGMLAPQTGAPFTNASLSGNFFGGVAEVGMQVVQAAVAPVNLNGSDGITGTTDTSSTSAQEGGSPFPAASYTVNADGTFSLNTSNGAVAGVIISSTQFVMFSPTSATTSYPTLLVMEK